MRSKKKYKVRNLESQKEYEVSQKELDLTDIKRLGPRDFHALLNNHSYNIKVLDVDFQRHKITLNVNGAIRNFSLTNELQLHINQLGLGKSRISKMDSLHAPMPGLVLDLSVSVGDVVSPGDTLCILEAMKMENILKASSPGQVKKVLVKKTDVVDKGQLLIEFE